MNKVIKQLQAAEKRHSQEELVICVQKLLHQVQIEVQKSLGKNGTTISPRLKRKIMEPLTLISNIIKDPDNNVDWVNMIDQLCSVMNYFLDIDCEMSIRLILWETFCNALSLSSQPDQYNQLETVVGKIFSFPDDACHLDILAPALVSLNKNQTMIWARLFSSVILPFYSAYPLQNRFQWEVKSKCIPQGLIRNIFNIFSEFVNHKSGVDLMKLENPDMIFASIAMLSGIGENSTILGTELIRTFMDTHFHVRIAQRDPALKISENTPACYLTNCRIVLSPEELQRWSKIFEFLNSVSCDWTAKFLVEILRVGLEDAKSFKYILLFRELANIAISLGKDNDPFEPIACNLLSLLSNQTAIPLFFTFLALLFDIKRMDSSVMALFSGTRNSPYFIGVMMKFMAQMICASAHVYFDLSSDEHQLLKENPVYFESLHPELHFSDQPVDDLASHTNCTFLYLHAKDWKDDELVKFVQRLLNVIPFKQEQRLIFIITETLVGLHSYIGGEASPALVKIYTELLDFLIDNGLENPAFWSVRFARKLDRLLTYADKGIVSKLGRLLYNMMVSNMNDRTMIASVAAMIQSHRCLYGLVRIILTKLYNDGKVWESDWFIHFLQSASFIGKETGDGVFDEEFKEELVGVTTDPESLAVSLFETVFDRSISAYQLLKVGSMLTLNQIYDGMRFTDKLQNVWNKLLYMIDKVSYNEVNLLRLVFKESTSIQALSGELLENLIAKLFGLAYFNRMNSDYISVIVISIQDAIIQVKRFFSEFFSLCKNLNDSPISPEFTKWINKVAVQIILSFGTPTQANLIDKPDTQMLLANCAYTLQNVSDDEFIMRTNHFGQVFSCRVSLKPHDLNPVKDITVDDEVGYYKQGTQVVESVQQVFKNAGVNFSSPDDFTFSESDGTGETLPQVKDQKHHRSALDCFITAMNIISNGEFTKDDSDGKSMMSGYDNTITFVVVGEPGVFDEFADRISSKWNVNIVREDLSILKSEFSSTIFMWNGTSSECIYPWHVTNKRIVEVTPHLGDIVRIRCYHEAVPLFKGVFLARLDTAAELIGYSGTGVGFQNIYN